MPEPEETTVPYRARLRIDDETVVLEGRAPTGPLRVADFLPVLQSFDNAIVDAATRAVERTGKQISCRAGCGACCRQMVPIGEDEAVWLVELLEQMPAERRTQVVERFRDAINRLSDSGLLDRVRSIHQIRDTDERRQLGTEYFRAGVPCPFLDDESCSIHADRPLRCREYLVTSPAENCRDPGPGRIEMVPLPRNVSNVLFATGGEGQQPRWIPMILILEWAAQHSGDAVPRFDGRVLFETFLNQVFG